ncbi:zinc-dependent alcohol dehydrogenase family protein [Marinitenerispora sediminis]|uniref:Alcohol dehydrogenase n=1 Tax=Marinitenerispora sediminis TaxID=1931232 RepID=A0A368T2I3_9ACTN|nr:zinc-dependent alcohol dehydrogenase family protein [Marinitenerispora sediminis]RCV49208.1 alcohol dehydrogenase [Marinitenerispora sediminis]RCV51541.1 alcohol dehydrogenase [Marinitenerispora sediminis]RCV55122.1 alcohol dehydrogenase [Marinitenerispora sediminis]
MYRAIARSFGPAADVVRVEPYQPDPPGPGEVWVRMTAATVNPSDLVTISGAYASRTRLPLVPGFEGVGVVERTGPDVGTLAVGDRVLPIGSPGAWQRIKRTEARWCFPVADGLTDAQAATSYINPLTAMRMIEEHVFPGRTRHVAVNAAGSATAAMLARMLHRRGVSAIGLVRGDPGAPGRAEAPWAAVLSTGRADWHEELRRRTGGRGPDVAFDAVGGAEGERLALTTAPGGRLVHYGLLSGRPLPADLTARRPDLGLHLFWLRAWVHAADPADVRRALRAAGELVRSGDAATRVQARFPLAEIGTALRAAVERGRDGKVLLEP